MVEETFSKRSLRNKLLKAGATFLAGASLATYACGMTYIEPGEQGVKQVKQAWWPGQQTGVIEHTYLTGKHFVFPVLEVMHRLPREVQLLQMHAPDTTDEDRRNRYSIELPSAHIETPDGFYVDADIDMWVKIVNPYKTITKVGAGTLYVDRLMKTMPDAMKATFGRLNAEDFYNVPRRLEKEEAAKEYFNQRLAEFGIEVDEVLMRYPRLHPAIQTSIEGKVVNDQHARTEAAANLKAAAQATLDSLTKLGENDSTVRIQTGAAYTTTRDGQRESYVRRRTSAGTRLRELAEAEKTRLINEAYEGPGSERLVCLEWAHQLSNMKYILWQEGGKNPLDLANVMKLCGGQGQ